MADLGHLEKMGRELKCPICLSLLKSAVSLVCNHVFCNSCILKSMKSVSNCPVCKVPFHRREVRPAPQIDNLVSIFKSMEVTVGVNILTTQVAPSMKNSDGMSEGNNEKGSAKVKTVVACRKKAKKRISEENKKEEVEDGAKTADPHPAAAPSFPAKKRIHVTPYPVSETPARPEKVMKLSNASIECEADKVLAEKLAADKIGEPLLSPFFWLRNEDDDDDDDETSEKLSAQQTLGTPPPYHAPCFSDIKDSDDEAPTKMTPLSKHLIPKDFDSEMFEWTQRACSPELCSTPIKKQTADKHRLDIIQEKECDLDSLNVEKGFPSEKIPESITSTDERKCTKKKKRPSGKIRRKRVKASDYRNTGNGLDKDLPEVPTLSMDRAKNSSHGNENIKGNRCLYQGRKYSQKRDKADGSHQRRHVEKIVNHMNDTETVKASVSLNKMSSNRENQLQESKGMCEIVALISRNDTELDTERARGTKFQHLRRRSKKSMDDIITRIRAEVPATSVNETKNQGQERLNLNLNLPAQNKQDDLCPEGSKQVQKQTGESKRSTRMRKQADAVGITKDGEKIAPALIETVETEYNQTSVDLQQNSETVAIKGSAKTKGIIRTSGDKILRKCGSVDSQICCAFCQSSNDTEVSGEIMHYFNGKPVAADYNGGFNVIHAHKNCTEWAPDVFFKADVAVNLASELARSRRIKCGCCGIRGAALGCFEKSCRKSFHVTCAKMMRGCQWDNENFVMLCPLHSSLKLPNETSELQRKNKRTPNGEPQPPVACRSIPDMSRNWKWPSGAPCKWVLCCSALTTAEKEIIADFTRLTAVPISKTWSPTVTHVIASTDENGACRRTLKFLMAVMEGKWILRIDWIKECLRAMEPIDEDKFEIGVDVHGISGGPLLGRLRVLNKQPKLFSGFRFYFSGDFTQSYKGYLQDLVLAAGGIVLQRKPISRDHKLLEDFAMWTTFIIYSLELPEKHNRSQVDDVFKRRQIGAEALAGASGTQVATHTWILDSIAACKLLPLKSVE